MEWQFQINWLGLVAEAKQRRKAQKLTQARLAQLAGVSTPTVSRFESGETEIQLPTVLSILGILGMTDQRRLVFPEPNPRYDAVREAVIFTGNDGVKAVRCAITLEAQQDHFESAPNNPVRLFGMYHERIEHLARRKYLARQVQQDDSVWVTSQDI